MVQSVPASYSSENALATRTPVYVVEITDRGSPPVVHRFSTHSGFDERTETILLSPIAFWRLGEISGSTAFDETAHHLNGTYQGSPTLGVTGAIVNDSNTAVTLNGSSQYISVTNNALFSLGDDVTLSAWVKLAPSWSDYGYVFSKGDNTYALRITPTRTVQFGKEGVVIISESLTSIALNVWTHVIAEKSGSAVAIYINGIAVTGPITNAVIMPTSDDLNLGRKSNGFFYFNGSLDELSLFAYALNANEVRALYQAGIASFPSDYMQLPRSIEASVEPFRGRSTISPVTFVLQDINNDVTALVADDIGGMSAVMKAGFMDIPFGDFITVHTGVIEGYRLGADLTGYEITMRDSSVLLNRKVFDVSVSTLGLAVSSSDTTFNLRNAAGFQNSGYIRVDNEIVQYGGKTATGTPIEDLNWRAITYGTGVFVAVSSDGGVASGASPTGWTPRVAAEANSWNGVTYAASLTLFVAVASTGTNRVMTSPNGITWTARSAPLANWMAVAWSSSLGLFAAVADYSPGAGNFIMTSPNGITWTLRTAGVGSRTIAWDSTNGVFTTLHMRSTDGINWTSIWPVYPNNVEYPAGPAAWRAIAWSSSLGIFVAVSGASPGGYFATSTDGRGWINRAATNAQFTGVAWSPTLAKFVAIGYDVTAFPVVFTSTDGIAWTAQTLTFPSNFMQPQAVIWSSTASLFIAVGIAGTQRVFTSPDAITWTARNAAVLPSPSAEARWHALVDNGSVIVAVADDSDGGNAGSNEWRAMTSTNGTTWTIRRIGVTSGVRAWKGITWSGSVFIAVASDGTASGQVATSPDGITWTARTSAIAVEWQAVLWDTTTSLAIAVANTGTAVQQIMTSPDGTTWTSRTAPAEEMWSCLATSGTRIVALAQFASNPIWMMSSTNGTTWAFNNYIENNIWTGSLWASSLGLFVGVSEDGTNRVATSPDGLNWTPRTAAEQNSWQAIAWSGTSLAAVARDGAHQIMTSTNATSWTARTAPAGNQWTAVTSSGSSVFVAVSATGSQTRSMYSTDDGVTWQAIIAQLSSMTRAQFGTTAAAHAINATVQEILHIGPAHPMDIVISVCTNTDKSGASIDPAFIDIARFSAIKNEMGASKSMEFFIYAAVNLKNWLEDEIYGVLGIYPASTGEGLISAKRMLDPNAGSPAPSPDDTIGHDHMIQIVAWDGNYTQSLFNSISFNYDPDILTGQFRSSRTITDDVSIANNGLKPLIISSNGMRTTLFDTDGMIEDVADLLLTRYGNTAPLVRLRTFLSKHLIEAGDVIAVTSPLLPNHQTGTRGITAQKMECISRAIVWDQGVVELNLLDVTWGS